MKTVHRNYSRQSRPGTGIPPRRRRSPLTRFLLLTVLLAGAIHFAMGSTVREALQYQGRLLATEILAEETLSLLQETGLDYGALVQIAQDGEGRIISVETNAGELGRLKSRLEQNIAQALEEQRRHSYSLPLGTLLGSEWLAGRGPDIPFRLVPVGSLCTTVESRFHSAGINQTSHQIVLGLTLELSAMVPLRREPVTVHTDFVAAETIIVGEIPQYYTNITVPQGELAGTLREQGMDPWDLS